MPKPSRKKEALERLKSRMAPMAVERKYTAYETPESEMLIGDPTMKPRIEVLFGQGHIETPRATYEEAKAAGFEDEYEEEYPLFGDIVVESVGKPKKKKKRK